MADSIEESQAKEIHGLKSQLSCLNYANHGLCSQLNQTQLSAMYYQAELTKSQTELVRTREELLRAREEMADLLAEHKKLIRHVNAVKNGIMGSLRTLPRE
jgi:septal ring factor EnvC (AmiA/AmiB activator)